MELFLSASDCLAARMHAKDVLKNARTGRWKQKFDMPGGSAEELRLKAEGFAAEIAVARWADCPWNASLSPDEGADVGFWGQVKRRDSNAKAFDLLVNINPRGYSRDPSSYAYLLVKGEMPRFEILGWIGGAEITRREPQKLRSLCWKVPETDLRKDFSLLQKILASEPLQELSKPKPIRCFPIA